MSNIVVDKVTNVKVIDMDEELRSTRDILITFHTDNLICAVQLTEELANKLAEHINFNIMDRGIEEKVAA